MTSKEMLPNQWFIHRDGDEGGPYSPAQLKQLAATGKLRPDDLVRRGDKTTARLARDVKGLFAPSDGNGQSRPSPLLPQHQRVGGESKKALEREAAGDRVTAASTADISPNDPSLDSTELAPFGKRLQNTLKTNLTELFDSAKEAKTLGTLHARKTHLTKIALPSAFLALGKEVYANDGFDAQFPELFRGIAEVEKEIADAGLGSPKPETEDLKAKLRADASRLKSKGHAAVLSMKRDSLLRELGRTAYEARDRSNVPDESIAAISACEAQIEKLDAEIQQTSSSGRPPFSQRASIIALSSFLFFPVGLFFIRRHPHWDRTRKLRWTGVVGAFLAFAMIADKMQPRVVGSTSDTASVTAAPPEPVFFPSEEPYQDEERLTAEYLPAVFGHVRLYEEQTFEERTGAVVSTADIRERFVSPDRITVEESVEALGGVSSYSRNYELLRSETDNSIQLKRVEPQYEGEWKPFVKVGARPGDEWEAADGTRYRLVEFKHIVAYLSGGREKINKVATVLGIKTTVNPAGEQVTKQEWVALGEGFGVHEIEVRYLLNGRHTHFPATHRELISSRQISGSP